jgi:hypothetical protein
MTAAVFSLEFKVFDLVRGDMGVEEGIARLTGECTLHDDNAITNLRMDRIDIFSLDRERLPWGTVYGYATIGTRHLPYRVRARLPEGSA